MSFSILHELTDLVDTVTDAELAIVDDLKPGDELYDFYGGRHELSDVKVFTTHVATIRRDGHVDRWDRGAMTVARALR